MSVAVWAAREPLPWSSMTSVEPLQGTYLGSHWTSPRLGQIPQKTRLYREVSAYFKRVLNVDIGFDNDLPVAHSRAWSGGGMTAVLDHQA
jgi:hypothetical protein